MATVEEAQLSELAQLVAYHEMRQALEDRYPGQWVVLCNSELVGHYDAYEEARTGAREQGLDLLDCLIQKVGAQPPIILSYGK